MTLTPLTTSDISIIIPTLNEEQHISRTLARIPDTVGEVIVVDGGSDDRTVDCSLEAGARVESCSPCRAVQLNRGAQSANGEILLFLHGDTLLPANFASLIVSLLNTNSKAIGAFQLSIEGGGLLKLIGLAANLRSNLLHLPYGDQAYFTTAERFSYLGGFPETPIMEDFIFIRQAKKTGSVIMLRETVITSNRRWRKIGVITTTLLNQIIVIGYYMGIPLRILARLYGR